MIDSESKDSESNNIYPPGKNPKFDENPVQLKESPHQSHNSSVPVEPFTDEDRPDPTMFSPEEYALVVMSLIHRGDIENAGSRNRRRKRMVLSDDDDVEYDHGVMPIKLSRDSSLSFSSEYDSSSRDGLNTDDEDKERIVEDTNEEQFELDELFEDGISGDKTYVHFLKLSLTSVI